MSKTVFVPQICDFILRGSLNKSHPHSSFPSLNMLTLFNPQSTLIRQLNGQQQQSSRQLLFLTTSQVL